MAMEEEEQHEEEEGGSGGLQGAHEWLLLATQALLNGRKRARRV